MEIIQSPGIWFQRADRRVISRGVSCVPGVDTEQRGFGTDIRFGLGFVSKTVSRLGSGAAAVFPLRFSWQSDFFVVPDQFLCPQQLGRFLTELIRIVP